MWFRFKSLADRLSYDPVVLFSCPSRPLPLLNITQNNPPIRRHINSAANISASKHSNSSYRKHNTAVYSLQPHFQFENCGCNSINIHRQNGPPILNTTTNPIAASISGRQRLIDGYTGVIVTYLYIILKLLACHAHHNLYNVTQNIELFCMTVGGPQQNAWPAFWPRWIKETTSRTATGIIKYNLEVPWSMIVFPSTTVNKILHIPATQPTQLKNNFK